MARLPNAPISDTALRAAFMMDAPKPRYDAVASVKAAPKPKISPRKPPRATLSAYKPSLGERIQDGIASGLSGLGVSERYAGHFAGRAMAPLNDVTPVGNATGIADGMNDFRQGVTKGNLAQGALGLGVIGLNVLPFAGGAKRRGANALHDLMRDETGAIRAWHGSPHDFDKFDNAMIGTGEGNQAYGRGMYFADRPGVAGSYVQPRGAEPQEVPPEVKRRLHDLLAKDDYLGFDSFGQAIHAIRTNPTDFERAWEVSDAAGIRSALDAYDNARWPQGKRPRLYEVEIDADPEDFADWDALGATNAQRAVTEGEAKGIKYLDGDSRHFGGGSYNYVVPDPSLVRILNKY
jgi:hypothetical protein